MKTYKPHPKQKIFHESPPNKLLYGGARGPGMSHELPIKNNLREKQIAFMKASTPIFKALANVKNKGIPKITVFPDGKVEYEYSEEVKRFEEACFKEINQIKQTLDENL